MIEIPIVLITHTLPNEWISSLDGKCIPFIGPKDATELAVDLCNNLPHAHGLLTLLTIPIGEKELKIAKHLRVISNMAVGVDNIDLEACTKRKIPVGNTPDVLTDSTADLTIALLLAAARRLIPASEDARHGLWKTWSPTGWLGADLNGSTLGIIGMGKIGQAVAKRATSFNMRIIFSDPSLSSHPLAQKCSLEDIFTQCDFISLHVPLTPDTFHLINTKALRLMKPNVVLINASRGAVIDMMALHDALSTHSISAAALDVTEPEPLPPSHPLYSLPNCLIVPHIGSATWNTRRRMAELACENLLAGLQGQRLPNCVNPEVYDI